MESDFFTLTAAPGTVGARILNVFPDIGSSLEGREHVSDPEWTEKVHDGFTLLIGEYGTGIRLVDTDDSQHPLFVVQNIENGGRPFIYVPARLRRKMKTKPHRDAAGMVRAAVRQELAKHRASQRQAGSTVSIPYFARRSTL